jgi:phosphatidylglycerol:prolipoprotein diacylglycerol transferase
MRRYLRRGALRIMFVLAWRLPPRPRGELVGWLLLLYGVFRIAVEFFREPDVQLGFIAGGWLTMGMILSAPMIMAGIGIVAWAKRKRLPQSGRPATT